MIDTKASPLVVGALLVGFVVGCEAPAVTSDAGEARDGAASCVSDRDCDDGVFCNGEERCTPGASAADARGCAAAETRACAAPSTCNEAEARCVRDCPDGDGDGHGPVSCGGDDCDDEDPTRYPGAVEVCDAEGHDEDCDDTTLGPRDVDGDGVDAASCCNGARCALDCDDSRRGTNPSVPEVCDGLDNDCDGAIDEGLRIELFLDRDHDGVGVAGARELACPGTPGHVAAVGDCDDTRASVRPSAAEICDEIDNDCDGVIDEATLSVPWYVDADGDGWGVVSADAPPVDSCVPPAGRAIRIGDCDDTDAAVSPTARELCNGRDDDCNGRADYAIGTHDSEDDDGDGVPDAACGAERADCDDRDPYTSGPESVELCDARDNDCDGVIDEGASEVPWYADMDGDGHGAAAPELLSCAIVPGRVLLEDDCEDAVGAIHPGAVDACGGLSRVDDDCDGDVDEGGAPLAFYVDLDGDGYGAGEPIHACQSDARSAARGGDCDDSDPRVSPAALDDCAALAGVDDDCDGRVDETLAPRTFYVDADGDGHGAGAPTSGCVQPPGTSTLGDDCDDSDRMRNPGVPDDCATRAGIDDDCDVSVDEGRVLSSYYLDRDGDGYGAGPAMLACSAPAGTSTVAGDCDDDAPMRSPAAPDDCTRTPLVDDDCDGRVDEAATLGSYFRDTDGDSWGSGDPVLACSAPSGHVARAGDCDESSAARNPGRLDDCAAISGLDDDCDGSVDEGAALMTFYRDADRDGHGDPDSSTLACGAPAGFVTSATDCDDTRADAYPGATEICNDGFDNDCDGASDCADSECTAGCPVLRVLSGDGQSAAPHAALAAPVRVRVEDRAGAPLAGRIVTLSTTHVSTDTSFGTTTDSAGEASFMLRAPTYLGPETITVSSPGAVDGSVTVTAIAPAVGTIYTLVNGRRDSVIGPVPVTPWRASGTGFFSPAAVAADGSMVVGWNNVYYSLAPDAPVERLAVPPPSGFSSSSIAVDDDRGRALILVSGSAGCRIWAIDLTTGALSVVAGQGSCGYVGDGLASEITFEQLYSVAVADSGLVYFLDGSLGGRRLRVLDTGGAVRTVAGVYGGGTDALRLSGTLSDIATIPGSDDVYVSGNCSLSGGTPRACVVRVTPAGELTLIAGTGADAVGEGVAATSALILAGPVAVDDAGRLFLLEGSWNRVRRIDVDGTIRTIAGTRMVAGDAGDEGPASAALFRAPTGIAIWQGSHLLITDAGNRAIRAVW